MQDSEGFELDRRHGLNLESHFGSKSGILRVDEPSRTADAELNYERWKKDCKYQFERIWKAKYGVMMDWILKTEEEER